MLISKQTNVSPSGFLCTSSLSPPSTSVTQQHKWSINNQLNENTEKTKKCDNSAKHDRRMAKQMTERKRRDRINALLDNLRTLILKLLHKNPRHHRKLEKADILELVVSFLKKELYQTRIKTTNNGANSQQIESSSPIVYPQNCTNNLTFPLQNQSTNYYFIKSSDPSKVSYPIYDYIQQCPNPYATYSYNLPCKEHHQYTPSTHHPYSLSYQPVMLISTEDDINKENQLPTDRHHDCYKSTLVKNLNYYPSCYYDTLEQNAIRQPLNILNNDNNNNSYNQIYQQTQLKQSTPQFKLYPDILNSHLNEEKITVQDENYPKCYMYSYNDTNQSLQSFTSNKNIFHNNNTSLLGLDSRRAFSTESTNHETLWRPYV
ncbi:unnamed protein product [Heterobilharzia americana]|nr:unnamed protein product [Heterobilharzia americana]